MSYQILSKNPDWHRYIIEHPTTAALGSTSRIDTPPPRRAAPLLSCVKRISERYHVPNKNNRVYPKRLWRHLVDGGRRASGGDISRAGGKAVEARTRSFEPTTITLITLNVARDLGSVQSSNCRLSSRSYGFIGNAKLTTVVRAGSCLTDPLGRKPSAICFTPPPIIIRCF
ncbi:hypothetical protein J6590_055730 [Homalodisca vitripennis]|nr:hypothetical protein J6590_055730 [Homalodisca vitripennis]